MKVANVHTNDYILVGSVRSKDIILNNDGTKIYILMVAAKMMIEFTNILSGFDPSTKGSDSSLTFQILVAVIFNKACHLTTMGQDYL